MAVQYFIPANISRYQDNRVENNTWEFKQTLSGAGNGNPVLIPTDHSIIGVSLFLYITTGSGKIQYTGSKVEDVIAGNSIWQDWDNGQITNANSSDWMRPCTALRLVNASGTVTMNLRAQ